MLQLGISILMLPLLTRAYDGTSPSTETGMFALLSRRGEGPIAKEFSDQWINPAGVLGIIMIIGGDVVQKALAQLVGTSRLVPVCFSFGWITMAVTNVIALAGDGNLMPPPDCDCLVFNCESGYARSNKSFMLGRLMRDTELLLDDHEALCVYVRKAVGGKAYGNPDPGVVKGYSKMWYVSCFTMVVQLGFAAIPWGLYGDWSVFVIVAAGTLLAMMTAALPQWRAEKYACRDKDSKTNYALTRGNGTRHILLILGNGACLNIETLANAESPRYRRVWKDYGLFRSQPKKDLQPKVKEVDDQGFKTAHSTEVGTRVVQEPLKESEAIMVGALPADFWFTRVMSLILAVLWLLLLLTVSGLTTNAWFLLLSGSVGMVQNIVIAAIPRRPSQLGIHLEDLPAIRGSYKVMDILMDMEVEYPGTGKALVGEFFPGDLRENETAWWEAAAMLRTEAKYRKKMKDPNPTKKAPTKPDWDSLYSKYGSREHWQSIASEYDEERRKDPNRIRGSPRGTTAESFRSLLVDTELLSR